jgi:hypothetical protein
MRAGAPALILLIVLAMVALPVVGHAQSPSVTRGAFGRSLSPDATAGALRGAAPPGATVGAGRGSLPADATVGAVGGGPPSGGTVGAFRSASPSVGTVGVLPGGVLPMNVLPFRGSVPADATVGAISVPAPPGAHFGDPGPGELAQGLYSQARMSLIDGNYAQGEAMLNRSVAIREQMVGRDHPEVAGALEGNAKLLRQYNREAAAADMEVRAKEIRTRLEPPAPKEPERF